MDKEVMLSEEDTHINLYKFKEGMSLSSSIRGCCSGGLGTNLFKSLPSLRTPIRFYLLCDTLIAQHFLRVDHMPGTALDARDTDRLEKESLISIPSICLHSLAIESLSPSIYKILRAMRAKFL